jgi:hypothetical protein
MGARVYDPYTGTFTQPDPIKGGGANAYGYTDGDPVNETDLSGDSASAAGEAQANATQGYNCSKEHSASYCNHRFSDTTGFEVAGGVVAVVVTAGVACEAFCGPAAEDAVAAAPKPPGFDPDTWTEGPASRPSVSKPSTYDPDGGEWHYHEPDSWHPDPHWDYKPASPWNAPWQRVSAR